MYVVIYLFRIRQENLERFLEVQRQAAAVYREHGALEDVTYVPADLTPRYGCGGFAELVEPGSDETVAVEVVRFRDRAHCNAVAERVDADPRIGPLFAEATRLVELRRVLRGEFLAGA